MPVLEKLTTTPIEPAAEAAEPQSVESYVDMAARLSHEKVEPAQTIEEALERVTAAKDAYESLLAPPTDMRDTPKRDLRQLLVERQKQYWMDRDEIRDEQGKYVLQRLTMDATPTNNAWRLVANLPETVPNNVLMWGVVKTLLAGRLRQEAATARKLSPGGDPTLEGIVSEDEWLDINKIARGDCNIEIHDGQAQIVVPNIEAELMAEIAHRRLGWQERHKLLARSRKMRKVMPFLANAAAGARNGSQLFDLLQYHYVDGLINRQKEPAERA